MRTISNFKFIFIFFMIFLFFIQCDKEQTSKSIDPDFTGYISAFTSGVISKKSTIKIRLAEVYSKAKINEQISGDLFEFTPNIEGNAYWLDTQTIEFKPNEKLPSGKLFEAEFFLSKLLSVPKKLKTLEFKFQVLKQAIDVDFLGMEAIDQEDLKWQLINGSILTYDYADSDNLENSFTVLQEGKELPIKWEHNTEGKTHQFVIDSVKRTETRNQVILQWNGKQLGFDKKGEEVFEVPSLGEFKVLDVKITQQPEQFVTIYFSDPIQQKQDLEGLIYLESGTKLKMIKETNAVKIYPISRQKGSVKLKVTDGIRNTIGYQLMEPFERQITFTSVKPAVELLGKGVIMPSTNGLIFPFKAVNLNAVNVKIIKVFEKNIAQFLQVNPFDGNREMKRVGRIVFKGEIALKSDKPINYESWNPFYIDLSKLIDTEPGAIYRVSLSFDRNQSLYPCEEDVNEKENLIESIAFSYDKILFYDENHEGRWCMEDREIYMIYNPHSLESFSNKIIREIHKGLKELYNVKDIKVFLRKQKLNILD